MNAATDALLFTQTFSLLAEKYGLGVCYLGTTLYKPNHIIDELKLPRLVMPIATLTIGYPDEKPAQTDRLPLAAVLHEETYCDYTKEAIDEFFTEKESLPENRHYVEINQKETLAQIFTDIRYNRRDNEMMSEELLSALKRQGFLQL
jgi:FMN reductase [NAD(P)H]